MKKNRREDEEFDFSNLSIGESYSKLDCMALADVTIPKQARDITGITRFKNCVVLFVTLDKQDKEDAHKYYDMFLLDGKKFHWESQNNNTLSTPHMQMILNNESVILFARVCQKIKGKTQPFTYVGELNYLEHDYPIDNKDTPIEVLFDVSNHEESANANLNELYQWSDTDEEERAPGDSVIPSLIKKVRKSGQGRMVNARKKKAIEIHAMGVARKYYESEKYVVVDTSANHPYDLECFKGDDFKRVEVKGTTSKGDNVYVTSGEVIDARSDECETDLFIVFNIKVMTSGKDQYTTAGEDRNILSNWKPKAEDLEPKTYKYHLPK